MKSKGTSTWNGDLFGGSGTASLDSGAAGPLPVSWASRTEAANGKTSPEELIAAAHAACYSMAFRRIEAWRWEPAGPRHPDAGEWFSCRGKNVVTLPKYAIGEPLLLEKIDSFIDIN